MKTKLVTSLLWAVSSCLTLWLFNFAQPKSVSFESFWLFSFMVLGGGGGYHFFIEILQTPYSQELKSDWRSLQKEMFFLMLPIISVPVVVLAAKEWAPPAIVFLGIYFYLLFAFAIAVWRGLHVERQFKHLRSNAALASIPNGT